MGRAHRFQRGDVLRVVTLLCALVLWACGPSQPRCASPEADFPGDCPDDDGVYANDLCPNVPEDLDGFEDLDGCPEPGGALP